MDHGIIRMYKGVHDVGFAEFGPKAIFTDLTAESPRYLGLSVSLRKKWSRYNYKNLSIIP